MHTFTTVDFYTKNYLMGRQAVIDTALFPFYALKASQVIKQYTFDNIDESKPFIDEIQMCCCEIAEILFTQDKKGHEDDIQSEKKGEWSTTYVSAKDLEDLKKDKIHEIIYSWLAMTDLLYRGCR